MKNNSIALSFCVACVFVGMTISCGPRQSVPLDEALRVRQMIGFPQEEKGLSFGVSACYAGLMDDRLFMAGGCNFPDTPAADGGKKCFYKGIYASILTSDSLLSWYKVGELPAPAAYGVSVTTPQGIVCIGGANAEGSLNTVYRISLNADKQSVSIQTLPSLPCSLDNFGGALLGNVIYIAGGNRNGIPSKGVFCMDLAQPETGWQELPDFPGEPRIQPVCAAQLKEGESQFYLWGGFAPAHDGRWASLSVDGYCYTPSTRKWMPVATPVGNDSLPISLGGGTAIAWTDSLILCMGGVDKDIFMTALQREEQLKKAISENNLPLADSLKAAGRKYMLEDPAFYHFNDRICVYNTRSNRWTELLKTSKTARAGAALVGKGNRFISINGELKPGIRTPEIVEITFDHQ